MSRTARLITVVNFVILFAPQIVTTASVILFVKSRADHGAMKTVPIAMPEVSACPVTVITSVKGDGNDPGAMVRRKREPPVIRGEGRVDQGGMILFLKESGVGLAGPVGRTTQSGNIMPVQVVTLMSAPSVVVPVLRPNGLTFSTPLESSVFAMAPT